MVVPQACADLPSVEFVGGAVVLSDEGTDTLPTLLCRQLTARWPDHFSPSAQAMCEVCVQDGMTCFTVGDVEGYIKDWSVFLRDGTFLGLLCHDVPMRGPLAIHKDIPPRTQFLYNRDSASRSSLRSLDPADTTLSLTQSEDKKGHLQIDVVGKRTVPVIDHKKIAQLQEMITSAIRAHVESIFGAQHGSWLLVNNGSIVVNLPTAPKPETDFEIVRDKLVADARGKKLRKRGGDIYEPVADCPCAYVVKCTYEKFITSVLRGDAVFRRSTKRYRELLEYITVYDEEELPLLVVDRDIMSFSNGVLRLTTGVFSRYTGMDTETAKLVARHHICQPYLESTTTPLLDRILDAQFSKEVAHVLMALIGRCFFTVGQLDEWQVMLFMVGVGGTGKSLILNIVQQLFAAGMVGTLAAKGEEIFGMANLVDKELILGRDMPAKMSGCLPQEIMQTMTAGEDMGIPRKGKEALFVRWTAPLIFAGNHQPDYTNTGNNIGRRMVSFRFDNVIAEKNQDLKVDILETELPNIVCRSLQAYKEMRVAVRERGDFWKAVPPVMDEWKNGLAAATNRLSEFFAKDEVVGGWRITLVPGRVTWVKDFKAVFEADMGKGTFVQDNAVFAGMGFRVSDRKEKACKSCKQLARSGCCSAYSDKKRIDQLVIHDMELLQTFE